MKGENVMSIAQSLLRIRKTVIAGAGVAKNYVKKHPTACITTGAAGLTGLVIAKALTTSRKQATDDMNRMILTNPALNPLGCFYHVLNPNDTTPNAFDGPILKYFVDKNNQKYQEYYNNLSPSEKVQEFYKNGGKEVNFNHKNHLCNVVKADDGGKIYVYSDTNDNVIGSINTDKYGRLRNIAHDNPFTHETDLSVNTNPETGKIRSVYLG